MNKQEFIEAIAKYVIKYAPQYGICVYSPIIAQACLESGYGTSNKVFCNGEWRHNYFGLKWRDKRCAISNDYFEEWTSEQRPNGSRYNKVDKFYKFKSIEEGVIGYFQWTNTSKYSNLKGCTDPKEYLQTIKKDGYATSLNYVENVYNVIISNNLTKYDIQNEGSDKVGNSSLVNYTKISPNKTVMTNKVNKKITIHHMAGNLSVETCANVFSGTRKASSNYGIGTDGRVGLYVDEKDRAWTSSSSANDSQAVTIEVANNSGAPNWTVSDKAFNKLIDLCVDICKRNGIKKLIWTGDKTGTLTCHYMFAATACPGPYLKSKMPEIANLVNARLSGTTTTTPEVKKYYRVRKSWEDSGSQIGAYALLENAKAACKEGYAVYDWNGNEVYSKKEEYYTVKKGDTLSKIGVKLGVKWQDIAKLNNIKAPYTIYPNQKLKIK